MNGADRADHQARRRAVDALVRAGRSGDASAWLKRAVAGGQGDIDTRLDLLCLQLACNDFAAAVATLQAMLAIAPDDLRALAAQRRVGLALFAANLWEDAAPFLEAGTALEPWDRALDRARARTQRPARLAPEIVDPHSGRVLKRSATREGDAYTYVLDVVGTCNLRCPTCPVGNSPRGGRPVGFMDFALFEKIARKMRAESPSRNPIVALFNWGEPLLHLELPRMVALLRSLDMRTQLSTNLNIKRGLEEAIAAGADELKISISGFSNATYMRTHRRGDLELVKSNMLRVREHADRHKVATRIWVGHHIYRSNAHEAPLLQQFCEQLGFAYHAMPAFYMPMERLIDLLDGKADPADADVIADLLRSPQETAQFGARVKSGDFDCELRFNQTVINHDGSVALCCTVYDEDNMLGVNFLDEPFDALERRKYAHPFCKVCYERRLEYAPPELARVGL